MINILRFIGAVVIAVLLIGAAIYAYILTALGLWAHEENKRRKKEQENERSKTEN